MKNPSRRRWILWLVVPSAIAGFLGLLSLPFVIDEPPPDDAHLRPVRRQVPAERNGFFAVDLTSEEADAVVEKELGKEELSEEELEEERECEPFTEGWNLELAERLAHGVARDRESPGELAFRRKPGAGKEGSVRDAAQEVVADALSAVTGLRARGTSAQGVASVFRFRAGKGPSRAAV